MAQRTTMPICNQPTIKTQNDKFNLIKEIMTMERNVRDILEREFSSRFIRQRKGNFGAMLDYIEAHVVIQRLNQAFQGDWSFEVSEYTQLEDEVVVLGKLTAAGVVKQQFGGSKITRAKGSDHALCIGDDLKAAASDALKKTATLMGIGLHLYGEMEIPVESTADTADAGAAIDTAGEETSGVPKQEETPKSDEAPKVVEPPKTDMSRISGNLGSSRISKDQLSQIKKLRKDLGWSADDVLEKVERMFATKDVLSLNSTMGQALISYLENQGNGRG